VYEVARRKFVATFYLARIRTSPPRHRNSLGKVTLRLLPPSPSVMCDQRAHEFELKTARGRSDAAPGLAAGGIAAFRFLARPAQRHVLLCTDLHTGNVLAAEREPWLVIDPKPYVGDPTYDVLQHMLNCDKRLQADPGDLVARMADLASLDAGRLRSGCSPAVSKSRPDGPPSARSQCLSRRSHQQTANSDLTAITSRSEPADIPALATANAASSP
jgi:hypothetical protein